MRDTLHNIDKLLVNNQTTIRDALLSFETYTASLKGNVKAIDSFLGQSDDALAGVDRTFARIDDAVPGLAHGEAGELLQKLMESSSRRTAAARKTQPEPALRPAGLGSMRAATICDHGAACSLRLIHLTQVNFAP